MLEKTVPEMLIGCLKYDEKLPYLHKITKQKFLVSNTNMGLCLYMFPYETISMWVTSAMACFVEAY